MDALHIPQKVYKPSIKKDVVIKGVVKDSFSNIEHNNISYISIANGVLEIGDNAFAGINLNSPLILPNSINKIGKSILGQSSQSKRIYNNNEDVHKLLIENNNYKIIHEECSLIQDEEQAREIFYDINTNHPLNNETSTNSNKNSNPENEIDDKNISKNKNIFHKYTRPFSVINRKGKTYKATILTKNNRKYFILNNGGILSTKKYQRTYQQNNNVKKVKIINHGGVNIYRSIKFSKQNFVNHAKFNQKFKVIAVKHLNYDITRYKLSNGLFITTHKRFVKAIK
ncbi:DUF5776 domain-containing protein [Apilactobacillus xinyiensis]|uniref:DUF5776 domain-containing protein n=1 Tax=Apilactobacillus xinyiensis TaxID=2841032 RepID=UPI003364F6D2